MALKPAASLSGGSRKSLKIASSEWRPSRFPASGRLLGAGPEMQRDQRLDHERRGIVPSLGLHQPRYARRARPHRKAATPAPAPARWHAPLSTRLERCERKYIEGDRSIQIQTVCAASHSRSRTNRWLDPAERRQSISVAESPCSKLRYCQNVSPGPGRRLPCVPCATVVATRRASTRSAGSLAARSCAASSSATGGCGCFQVR